MRRMRSCETIFRRDIRCDEAVLRKNSVAEVKRLWFSAKMFWGMPGVRGEICGEITVRLVRGSDLSVPSGATDRVIALVNGLVNADYDVHLVVPKPKTSSLMMDGDMFIP